MGDRPRITLRCQDCGVEFTLSKDHYKTLPSNYHFRCKCCRYKEAGKNLSELYKNFTDEEREARRIKRIEQHKSLSDEKKLEEHIRRSNAAKQRWKNLSKEEQERQRLHLKQISIEQKSKLSDEDKKEIASRLRIALNEKMKDPLFKDKISKSIKKRWENRSDEYKLSWGNSRKEWWASIDQETRDAIKDKESAIRSEWWKNLSDEEKIAWADRARSSQNNLSDEVKLMVSIRAKEQAFREKEMRSNRSKRYWENMTTEQRLEMSNKFKKARKRYFDNITEAELKSISDKTREFWKSLSDEEKCNRVKHALISSNGNNKLHEQFLTLYNSSGLQERFYLSAEYPTTNNGVTHCWDYGVFDENNELIAVVDLDGMYFHADICDYDGFHSKEEYDECRFLSIQENITMYIILERKLYASFHDFESYLLLPRDKIADVMIKAFRLQSFPYPHHTKVELLRSYDKLARMKPNDKYHKDLSLNTRQGDWLAMEFHQSIWHDHRDGELSPYDAWNDDNILRSMINSHQIYQTFLNPNKILQGFNSTRVQFMSGGRAKMIISRYLEEFDTIFDPFSGYSGRMLGTISSCKKYIGQDISERHVAETNNIIDFLHQYAVEIDATVTQKDVFQSSGEYPCLFTCPPTGNEVYEDVAVNTMSCDDWIDVCLERFRCHRYVFVVNTTEKYAGNIIDKITNKSNISGCTKYIIII